MGDICGYEVRRRWRYYRAQVREDNKSFYTEYRVYILRRNENELEYRDVEKGLYKIIKDVGKNERTVENEDITVSSKPLKFEYAVIYDSDRLSKMLETAKTNLLNKITLAGGPEGGLYEEPFLNKWEINALEGKISFQRGKFILSLGPGISQIF